MARNKQELPVTNPTLAFTLLDIAKALSEEFLRKDFSNLPAHAKDALIDGIAKRLMDSSDFMLQLEDTLQKRLEERQKSARTAKLRTAFNWFLKVFGTISLTAIGLFFSSDRFHSWVIGLFTP